ncbi:MAG: hypothetical protein IPO94_10290 [Saprospiraceae bacterium]|nr:hypothetical protein [Saprospiraceae bacterium]
MPTKPFDGADDIKNVDWPEGQQSVADFQSGQKYSISAIQEILDLNPKYLKTEFGKAIGTGRDHSLCLYIVGIDDKLNKVTKCAPPCPPHCQNNLSE